MKPEEKQAREILTRFVKLSPNSSLAYHKLCAVEAAEIAKEETLGMIELFGGKTLTVAHTNAYWLGVKQAILKIENIAL